MNKIYMDEFQLSNKFLLDTISFDRYKIPAYITRIDSPISASEEVTFECDVDPKLFSNMTGADISSFSDATGFSLEFRSPYDVQVRRHKKKRINKKWAKRYGYKTKFRSVRMTACSFNEFNSRHDGLEMLESLDMTVV
jgi:hypothetical protein